MINRVLIRIKVLQILFAYYQNNDKSFDAADKELSYSIEKAYDLYFYLLLLGVDLTRLYEKRIDMARNKFFPTDQERNPNLRLANNRLMKAMTESSIFLKRISDKKMSWNDQEVLTKTLLDEILGSDLYTAYLAHPEDSAENDRTFWVKVYKQIILPHTDLEETLEEQSLYWNDDLEIVGSFSLKTLKKFNFEEPNQSFSPMFKDDSDAEFAKTLFRLTYLRGSDYREIISAALDNWNVERLAFMDMLIIQMAVSELLNFPTIPVTVTLNEYIEIAKCYSTEKSGVFVNGILDKVVSQLRTEGKIFK